MPRPGFSQGQLGPQSRSERGLPLGHLLREYPAFNRVLPSGSPSPLSPGNVVGLPRWYQLACHAHLHQRSQLLLLAVLLLVLVLQLLVLVLLLLICLRTLIKKLFLSTVRIVLPPPPPPHPTSKSTCVRQMKRHELSVEQHTSTKPLHKIEASMFLLLLVVACTCTSLQFLISQW